MSAPCMCASDNWRDHLVYVIRDNDHEAVVVSVETETLDDVKPKMPLLAPSGTVVWLYSTMF
jgi:hypothetical protein